MNDQSGTAQLRFLEETAIRLRQNGFTVEPIEDHHLPVCWGKGRLCRISGKGSVLYRQECVDVPGAQDALQAVIDTAKMTSEYMTMDLLEALEIGDTVKADCKVVEFDSAYNVLKRMEQCTVNGEIIGTASLNRKPRRMSHRGEFGISLKKAWWGCGAASALTEAVLAFAKENGFEQLNLEVRSSNARAIHLYEKYGFRKLCTFPHFFKINGEYIDFDLMNLELNTADSKT